MQPRIALILSAAVTPFTEAYHGGQQRNSKQRLATYKRSLLQWAAETSLPICFVDSSNPDEAAWELLKQAVKGCCGLDRYQEFEFLRFACSY